MDVYFHDSSSTHLRTQMVSSAKYDEVEMEKIAYKIPEAVQVAPVGKTRIYEALNSGALKAHKQGSHTIIMRSDLESWLRAMPKYEPSPKAAA
jgi:excisionase family DNA binding protein